jgi:hypothetical protein
MADKDQRNMLSKSKEHFIKFLQNNHTAENHILLLYALNPIRTKVHKYRYTNRTKRLLFFS